ncbi:MAG: MFS transporter [Bacillota bacterium]|jgi:sugar phosphate permease
MENKKLSRLHSYRWVVWFVLLMAYVIVLFQRVSLNAVSNELQDEFKLSASGFAIIASAYPYAYVLMQIPIGIAVDYVGQRKTAGLGVLLTAIGSILFSMAHSGWALFIGRVLVGIGSATVFLSITKIQVNWFYTRQFASISGVTQLVSNTGGMLAQTPLILIVGAIGWRDTYEIIAGICLFISLLIFLLVKDKPADIGLPSIESLEGRKEVKVSNNHIWRAIREVIRNRSLYPAIIGCFSTYGSFFTFTGVWGIKYFTESSYEMTKATAGNYTISVTLGIALGSLIIGTLSDYTKKRKIFMVFSTFIGVVAWILITFIQIPEGILLYIVTFMIGSSCANVLISMAYTKEINDINYSGIAVSITNFWTILATAILPIVVGVIYDANKHLSSQLIWDKCMGVLLLINIIGFIASFFTKETNAKNITVSEINLS